MDFDTLIDDVLGFTQELQKQVDFTEPRYKKYINQGYYDFVERTACIEDEIDITTVANQFSYDTSDQANIAYVYMINEVRHLETTEVGRILKPYPGGYGGLPEEYTYGRPCNYWTRGMRSKSQSTNSAKKIGVWPIDSTSSNTIRLHVYRFPKTALSGATDEPEIEEAYAPALAIYAAYKLFNYYSHLKQTWRLKAKDLRSEYEEYVMRYLQNSSVDTNDISVFDYYGG